MFTLIHLDSFLPLQTIVKAMKVGKPEKFPRSPRFLVSALFLSRGESLSCIYIYIHTIFTYRFSSYLVRERYSRRLDRKSTNKNFDTIAANPNHLVGRFLIGDKNSIILDVSSCSKIAKSGVSRAE